ncbi:MAG TPA: protein translocase subunit SecD [Kofleriaceae bacterium]|jgi:preprotein translocase subunit SecD|nr:protein translocase subunit SecD [Kofleriaceae bacterium]
MDRSLKWRTLALLVGLLLCAGLLAPTWPGSSALPSWFPFKKKISLGLDLQGGVHIVYTIALDRAVEDKASEIKRDLDARFIDEKFDAKVKLPPVPLGAVTIVLPDAKRKSEIEGQIQSDYGSTINQRECTPDDGPNAICFQVSSSYADGIKKSALTNAVTTIRERINEKGVSEPSVVEKGDDIIVELPGDPKDPAMLETREIIAQTSKLEFKVVDDGTECRTLLDAQKRTDPRCAMWRIFDRVGSVGNEDKAVDPRAQVLEITAHPEVWRPEDGGGQRTDYYLQAYDRDESVPKAWAKKHGCPVGDTDTDKVRCRVTGQQALERYLFGDKDLGEKGLFETDPSLKIPDDHQIGFEPNYPDPTAKDQRTLWRTYYLDRAVRLTGSGISNAQPSNDPNTGRPVVLLDFNRFGGRVFGDLTSQIVGKKLATILDDKVRSAPIINGAIRGGRASITLGGGDVERQERERETLVNVLRTGSLPAPLVKQSESELGPTLGRDAIDKTKLSFIIGIILVVLIMVGVYRWSGWIAVFAVVFHIVMTLAVMAAFGATLTLPGVAAIVLSIGMEVDGNILIYERIRDELLLGKSVRGAIDLGFSRAFSAILDGQLTTAAAGWVLLSYGSGPIKGFAVMLLVGVFTTLSTNIWVTRIFFDWYVSRKKGQLATISI